MDVTRRSWVLALVVAWAVVRAASADPASRAAGSSADSAVTVGLEGVYFLRDRGPLLEARPAAEKAPLVLRVADVRLLPSGVRQYELRYIAAIPGEYDLRDYLVRVSAEPPTDLPPARISVGELLPAEHRGDLEAIPRPAVRYPLPYRLLLTAGFVAWMVPMAWFVGHWLSRPAPAGIVAPPTLPRTLADQLRPLVEQALAGSLQPRGQAQLETLLLAYWQRKLGLTGSPGELLPLLRAHAEAGPLVESLERWLYCRPAAGEADVAALLAPYRDAAPLEGEPARESSASRVSLSTSSAEVRA